MVVPAGAAAQAEAPAIRAGQRLGGGGEVLKIGRQFQAGFGEPVLPAIEVQHHILHR